MANRRQHLISLATTLGLIGLNLAALNLLFSGWSAARLDLTEDHVYSISSTTRKLLRTLDDDVTIQGYFSKRTHPKLAPLVPEIVDMLDEYAAVARGKLHVEVVDPGEDEQAEQEAADRFGVRSTPFRMASKYEAGIVNAYFAVVIRYGDQYVRYGFEDLIRVEPTPDGDIDVRLRNLEYDLTRAIKKVVYGFRSAHDLFERIEKPVRLTAIWTPSRLPEIFAGVPEAVRAAAKELGESGGERFVFQELDPTASPERGEELRDRYGAQPLSLGLFGGDSFYLQAVLEIDGRMEQIPLTRESLASAEVREAIENALRRQTPGFLTTVGIVAPKPLEIPPELRMQFPQPPPEYDEVQRFIEQDYRVRPVTLGSGSGVPSEVDVLLVLKPQDLSDDAVYELDQYLMRGGRVIVCAGSFNVDFAAQGLQLSPLESGLESWLEHLGVTIGDTLVLDDRNQPLPIPQVRHTPFGTMRTWTLAPYPYLVQVRDDGFRNPEITSTLEAVGIYWGSPVLVDTERTKDLAVIPILQSSSRSWTSDDLAAVSVVDYKVPASGTEPHLLAVALTGKFESFFAKPDASVGSAERARYALARSPETRLVVVGDSVFLNDFIAQSLAQVDGGFFTENLRFAQNLIDWSSMDNDMLEIRSRGLAVRRLERSEKGREIVVEGVNYAFPVFFLAALGTYRYWRRKNARPLVSGGSTPREA